MRKVVMTIMKRKMIKMIKMMRTKKMTVAWMSLRKKGGREQKRE